MARFISVDGKWKPAKEKVGLVNDSGAVITVAGEKIEAGDPYIYEGEDRDAKRIIKEQGGDLGQDYRYDTDFLQRVRNLGFAKAEDYIALYEGDIEKARENLAKEEGKVHRHTKPEGKKDTVPSEGGRDTASGEQIIKGSFGEPPTDVKK